MKIKRLKENIDIDPYMEEIWDQKDYSQVEAVCINCGDDNIFYDGFIFDSEKLYAHYICEECHTEGEELYNIQFVRNGYD